MSSAIPQRAAARPVPPTDFNAAPFVVIWEMTQACDLACLHCRASAQPRRDDRELTTDEAKKLMDTIRAMGPPLFVLTGGDPLKRPDTVSLVEYGTSIGLRVALTPSGTPLMTAPVLQSLRDAGLARLAVSLDGSTAAIHDRFRGVAGSFDWSVQMLRTAREIGLSTQVNTTISSDNVADLEGLIALMGELGIALWSVFVVVPTGRGKVSQLPTAEELERIFNRLYDVSRSAFFDIKTTAAPHFRRVVLQRQRDERRMASATGREVESSDAIGRARGVNDGNGFVFVSHRGEIFPSGFMPVSAGNVRSHDLGDVYRSNLLFQSLRNADLLKGKCGACEYRWVCGGSRSRAYALTGDPHAADPLCAYIPPAYARFVERSGATPTMRSAS
ncbi:MAG TPA: TIGR04053 family radical SAM/SPASM domain-containing protein [Gemmatimonadaceae bacterium]|nr:TIGR04053 family radical SAM/SPASM domain-containing protein [Gemmatimonadaceae bacterium]